MRSALSNIDSVASADVLRFLKGQDCRLMRTLVADKSAMRAYRVITILNATENLGDLRRFGGMCCEALKGDLKGFYSLRIDEKWRVVFRIEASTRRYCDVDITPHYE